MSKIERKYLAHYINVAASGAEPVYERLGKDLEEYSVEMGAQVEKKKNILGETAVCISGYEKTAAVETFYAEEGSELYKRLQAIIDNGMVLDQLKTDVVEVKLWEGASATKEEVYIEIKSYGGNTTGYQIPFALHYTGKRELGVFSLLENTFEGRE